MSDEVLKQESTPNPKDPRAVFQKAQEIIAHFQDTMVGVNSALTDLQQGMDDIVALREVTKLVENLLQGQLDSSVDLEARGELGKLLQAVNKTRDNLAQLDQGVHAETGKMPQLASFLDDISLETEQATNEVLGRLDEMIQFSESQSEDLSKLAKVSKEDTEGDKDILAKIETFQNRLSTDPNLDIQDALEHIALMGEQAKVSLGRSQEIESAIKRSSELAENQLNSAFDIMNLLQFQDITRQKVNKVITLLKEMQDGLFKLLSLFNLEVHGEENIDDTVASQATQDKIFTRHAFGDQPEVDVDSIINSFQQNGDNED